MTNIIGKSVNITIYCLPNRLCSYEKKTISLCVAILIYSQLLKITSLISCLWNHGQKMPIYLLFRERLHFSSEYLQCSKIKRQFKYSPVKLHKNTDACLKNMLE